MVVICAAGAAITGGFLWNVLNRLVEWRFHLGGSGNEPYGCAAFISGFFSAFSAVFFAFLVFYEYILSSIPLLLGILVLILLYALLGGLGTVLFYDSGFRDYIESKKYGYGSQELIIVTFWSLAISASTYFSLLVLYPLSQNTIGTGYLLVQIPLSVILSFLAVLLSLVVALPTAEINQLRGFFAGIALRTGLFFGVFLAVLLNQTSIWPP